MGNIATAGRRGQCGIWEKFFPEGLLEFAWVRDAGSCDALCMVLRSCCCSEGEGSRGRLEELCGVGRGLPILKEVVATACAGPFNIYSMPFCSFIGCLGAHFTFGLTS